MRGNPFPVDERGLVTFLQELIRIPSPSTQEGEVAARMAQEMREVGFAEVRIDRIGNVVGRIGSGEGPVLLYEGHMDTVGPGDPQLWPYPPYDAVIKDGVLYGRGAVDMKGALAAMVYGGKLLLDSGVKLAGTLYVAGVVQEEPCEGLAVRILIEEEGIRPDFVVIGEATDLQVHRGQRGRMEIEVNVHGQSCHASSPERGQNAIYAAARLIFGLELLAARLPRDPFLGQGSLAVTQIESKMGSRNVIPDRCTFYIDRRLTLGETETKALAEIHKVILREGVKAEAQVTEYRATSYTGYPCQAREYFPPWLIPEDHPLVRTAMRAVEETLGYRPRLGRWAFSTDGVYTMGVAGIPTVGFGPGEERYAHTVQEQIRVTDVVAATRVYARLATLLLGQ